MKVSVILPTYNERENVCNVIAKIGKSLKNPYEIIVVDDNSPDGTAAIVKSLHNPHVRVIKRVNERGLVSAIQRGIDEAKGQIVMWLDCDMSHPPELMQLMVDEIEKKGFDVVTASRYVYGGGDTRPWLRVAYSRAINMFASALLTSKITDYTTGFVAARKNVFSMIRLKGNYGEYCIQVLYEAHKAGFKIKELPYVNADRIAGATKTAESAVALLKHAWNYGVMIIKLRLGWV